MSRLCGPKCVPLYHAIMDGSHYGQFWDTRRVSIILPRRECVAHTLSYMKPRTEKLRVISEYKMSLLNTWKHAQKTGNAIRRCNVVAKLRYPYAFPVLVDRSMRTRLVRSINSLLYNRFNRVRSPSAAWRSLGDRNKRQLNSIWERGHSIGSA